MNTGVGGHFLLQGIFPIQGLNRHLCAPCIGRHSSFPLCHGLWAVSSPVKRCWWHPGVWSGQRRGGTSGDGISQRCFVLPEAFQPTIPDPELQGGRYNYHSVNPDTNTRAGSTAEQSGVHWSSPSLVQSH